MQNQPIDKEVKEFTVSSFDTIANDLALFKRVAETSASDEDKLGQLSLHVVNCAKKLAMSYSGKVENDVKLVFDIARILTEDERAFKAVGVVRAIWDSLDEQPEYKDIVDFGVTCSISDSAQKLMATTKQRRSCCWC